ncbi:TIGR01620 family protein [Exercitatus varius]|uniref:TIGR01620 family protein n=1 Tax=Exercitatus varius TaxID=67857 RepID=UPI00294B0793|nr:TIGR01620 family protein [Exercitatus varius]MDG2942323.1 TIGR01620 family protein [Exercitatus varius]
MNDKRVFNHAENHAGKEEEAFQAKREFSATAEITSDLTALDDENGENEQLEGELLTAQFERAIRPKSRWWKRAVIAVVILFLGATVAQSVQWLIDSWRANQWIYFAFSVVGCSVVGLGLTALGKEFLRLRKLRRHLALRAESAVEFKEDFDADKAKELCEKIASSLDMDAQHPAVELWRKQLNDGLTAREVGELFTKNVLYPIDKKAKKLITRSAVESGIVVAVSPLAVVDMLFLAWRNTRLINRIANIYGIELGYWSRLRLMRMVLINMAFTGATELVQDIGLDWLSQDITAKLSGRIGQGLGVGLLTARLGLKTMEFCRPLAFNKEDKPRLSHIHRELLSGLKNVVLKSAKNREKQNV